MAEVLADFVTKTDVLQNNTLLASYLRKVKLENVTTFLTALTSAAQKVSNCGLYFSGVCEPKDNYNI